MRGKPVVVLFIAVIFGVAIFGLVDAEPPSVSPWTSPPLTPIEMGFLVAELNRLEEVLSDETLGSQRADNERGWDSHAFAQYTGGVLAGLGYEVQLATDSHWPGGGHSWVLVNLAVSDMSPVWVPVEAVSPLGSRQVNLGRVQIQSASATEIAFDPRYATFEQTAALPSNQAPTAHISLLGSTLPLDVSSMIAALGSRDIGGEIVVYRWRVGEGEWSATRSWSTLITPTVHGPTSITLQVIDNQGASATESVQVRVIGEDHPQPEDCGCSK